MSDETTIGAEIVGAMKSDAPVSAEETPTPRQRDRAIVGNSKRPPSVRLARTGALLANGADSVGAAMVEAGYSPWTARVPSANGVTVGRALAAAAEVFPSTKKTLRALRPKAIEVLDRAMTLDKGERPDQGHLQASGLALKLAQEAGEEDDQAVTPAETHNAHRAFRLCARRFARVALRRAEQIGVEAALDELVSFESSERERFPHLLDINAPRPYGMAGYRT